MAGTARITIEVVDEGALAKFKELERVSRASLQGIQGASGGATFPLFERAGVAAHEAAEGTRSFREAVHVLHPILEEAGLGLGNLGAFAAASRAGLAGLAAALAGSVLVALAKVGDQAKKTKASIEDIFGAANAGKVTEQIRERAKALGVSPESIVGPVEKISDTAELRGGAQVVSAPGKEQFAPFDEKEPRGLGAATTLEQIGRIHGLEPGEGIKAADQLFEDFRRQAVERPDLRGGWKDEPRLTKEMVDALPRSIANALAEAVYGDGADKNYLLRELTKSYGYPLRTKEGGAQIGFDAVLEDLRLIAPQVEKQFQALTPEQKTVSGEATVAKEGLKSELAPAGEMVSTGLIKFLQELPGALHAFLGGPEAVRKFVVDREGLGERGVPDPRKRLPPPYVPESPENPLAGLVARQAGASPVTPISPVLTELAGQIRSGAQALKGGFDEAVEVIRAFAAQFQANVKAELQADRDAQGHAEGGHVRGPGTGTSDSVPAMLSAGEYVQPERAVRHYGLAHMDDIRTLRAPRPPMRFNIGGLVDSMKGTSGSDLSSSTSVQHTMVNASIARSDSASSSGPTHAAYFNFGGGERGPMLTSQKVIEDLEQDSVLYRLASGGRRSSAQS